MDECKPLLVGGFDAAAVAAYSNMCCIDPNQSRMDLFQSWGVTPAGPTRNPPVLSAPPRITRHSCDIRP